MTTPMAFEVGVKGSDVDHRYRERLIVDIFFNLNDPRHLKAAIVDQLSYERVLDVLSMLPWKLRLYLHPSHFYHGLGATHFGSI